MGLFDFWKEPSTEDSEAEAIHAGELMEEAENADSIEDAVDSLKMFKKLVKRSKQQDIYELDHIQEIFGSFLARHVISADPEFTQDIGASLKQAARMYGPSVGNLINEEKAIGSANAQIYSKQLDQIHEEITSLAQLMYKDAKEKEYGVFSGVLNAPNAVSHFEELKQKGKSLAGDEFEIPLVELEFPKFDYETVIQIYENKKDHMAPLQGSVFSRVQMVISDAHNKTIEELAKESLDDYFNRKEDQKIPADFIIYTTALDNIFRQLSGICTIDQQQFVQDGVQETIDSHLGSVHTITENIGIEEEQQGMVRENVARIEAYRTTTINAWKSAIEDEQNRYESAFFDVLENSQDHESPESHLKASQNAMQELADFTQTYSRMLGEGGQEIFNQYVPRLRAIFS